MALSSMHHLALPAARGPMTEALFPQLLRSPRLIMLPGPDDVDPLGDEDLQLALYCCYELHYRGLPGVSDRWEWEPSLLAWRGRLELAFEQRLRDELPDRGVHARSVPGELWDITRRSGGPSLSGWLTDRGTWTHAEELAIHRSAYQLKEADPHTWAIPRLNGRAKAAMVHIQADEYGDGVAERMHSTLFGRTMEALGLDPTYGAYLDRLPATTLATTNLISLLGLHRRLRGALVGHLALFEMTSVGPMGRYSAWLSSLGVAPEGRWFYDVHVEADQLHQHIAADELVGGLLEGEPELADDVMFGARALSLVEARFTEHLLQRWMQQRSSLRTTPAHAMRVLA